MTSTQLLRLILLLGLTLLSHGAFDETAAYGDAVYSVKGRRNIADDHVRVFYCTACGYQQNFNQIKAYLEETFPHLIDRVYGANYDVDPYKMMLARFLGYAQLTTILLTVFGEYILPALGMDMNLLRLMQNNRIATIFIVMLMGTAASKLTASGAFEIYFNDDLIFSKLETGRWPTLLEISNSIGEYGLLDNIAI